MTRKFVYCVSKNHDLVKVVMRFCRGSFSMIECICIYSNLFNNFHLYFYALRLTIFLSSSVVIWNFHRKKKCLFIFNDLKITFYYKFENMYFIRSIASDFQSIVGIRSFLCLFVCMFVVPGIGCIPWLYSCVHQPDAMSLSTLFSHYG